MHSQNGWPLVNATHLDGGVIPGTNVVPVPGVLAGDVALLLHWVGTQFNAHVMPLYNPGCWGWNTPTPIPGSNIYSNHSSGTAIDFNAPSFPWQRHTMTASQREACRKIVNQMDGLVAWGGDFVTVVDEMHFEINGTPEQIRDLAKKIKGGDEMVKESDFEYWSKAVAPLIIGEEWPKSEFNKSIGKTDRETLTRLFMSPKAAVFQGYQSLGKKAASEKWEKQIASMKSHGMSDAEKKLLAIRDILGIK